MKDLVGKKILIAGGTGFIGRRLTNYLSNEGSELHIISRKSRVSDDKVKYIQGDLNVPESLSALNNFNFDACVYMAANIPEIGQPKESYLDAKRSTLDPLVNFCNTFCKNVKRFVYVSTIDVLGPCDAVDYDENAIIGIPTPYGLAKYCGECYVNSYCSTYNVPSITLRFSQVYGPNEPIVRVIPIMKNAILNDKEFTIYSDGTELRRFLFIDDAVKAIICALKTERNGLYNIAGKETASLIELAKTFERVYNKSLHLSVLNKTKGKNNVPSITKAELEIGFYPNCSLEDGLRKIMMEEACNAES